MPVVGAQPKGKLVVYDLCSGTGAWSEPYREDGHYDVRTVELKADQDVRLLSQPRCQVHGVLCAPPCTDLCNAGALSWERKGPERLLEALALVDACIRFAVMANPEWWALENPNGRITGYLGPPAMWWDPCDYGDPWTKRTGLWGRFRIPAMPKGCPVEPTRGSIMDFAHSSEARAVTPPGFARAFYKANP